MSEEDEVDKYKAGGENDDDGDSGDSGDGGDGDDNGDNDDDGGGDNGGDDDRARNRSKSDIVTVDIGGRASAPSGGKTW